MAPEQSRASDVTPAADLYALGVVTFEMLQGKKPFSGQTVAEIVGKHAKLPPPELPVMGGLESLVSWLLEKKPEDRPESAVVVAAEGERIQTLLSGSLTGRSDPALSSRSGDAIEPAPASSSSLRLLAVVAVLLVVIAVGGFLSWSPPAETPAPVQKVDRTELLQKALARRGLDQADLPLLKGAAALMEALERPSDPSRQADLQSLVVIAETAPVSQELLRAKLDRLDERVGKVRGPFELRYLELYKQVSAAHTPPELAEVARTVGGFQEELEKFQPGD